MLTLKIELEKLLDPRDGLPLDYKSIAEIPFIQERIKKGTGESYSYHSMIAWATRPDKFPPPRIRLELEKICTEIRSGIIKREDVFPPDRRANARTKILPKLPIRSINPHSVSSYEHPASAEAGHMATGGVDQGGSGQMPLSGYQMYSPFFEIEPHTTPGIGENLPLYSPFFEIEPHTTPGIGENLPYERQVYPLNYGGDMPAVANPFGSLPLRYVQAPVAQGAENLFDPQIPPYPQFGPQPQQPPQNQSPLYPESVRRQYQVGPHQDLIQQQSDPSYGQFAGNLSTQQLPPPPSQDDSRVSLAPLRVWGWHHYNPEDPRNDDVEEAAESY